MKTLHELATKLQTFIIEAQKDAHNSPNMSVTKYNNLKLKIESKYHFPNVIVCIGISEAVFNIKEGTKIDGGLGPDEKHVRKWLGSNAVISELHEIWISMNELVKAEEEEKAVEMEGEADEAKFEAPKKHKKQKNDDLATLEEFFEFTTDTQNTPEKEPSSNKNNSNSANN